MKKWRGMSEQNTESRNEEIKTPTLNAGREKSPYFYEKTSQSPFSKKKKRLPSSRKRKKKKKRIRTT